MVRTSPAALIAVLACTLAACEQGRTSLTGPTPVTLTSGVTLHSEESLPELYGALTQGEMHSAAQASGFPCSLGPFGVTEQSHATISDSGNQTLVCRGENPLPGGSAETIPLPVCALHYADAAGSGSLLLTPSGEVIFTCQSR
jgi:hypothetical protein